MKPITMPGESMLWMVSNCTRFPRIGVKIGQRQEAVDHGRNAGQHFEHRLEHLADALGGVLAQVDRCPEPKGYSDGQGDQRSRSAWRPPAAGRPRALSVQLNLLPKPPVHSVPKRKSPSPTWVKNVTVGASRDTTMPMVTATDSQAAATSRHLDHSLADARVLLAQVDRRVRARPVGAPSRWSAPVAVSAVVSRWSLTGLGLQLVQLGLRGRLLGVSQRHELGRLDDLLVLLQVELDELLRPASSSGRSPTGR